MPELLHNVVVRSVSVFGLTARWHEHTIGDKVVGAGMPHCELKWGIPVIGGAIAPPPARYSIIKARARNPASRMKAVVECAVNRSSRHADYEGYP